ncbi:MAG: hypothetical protein HYX24_00745 [Candidatus Aenigmarchaeota archaeon]|nr:hypothetical protein [Candidatus Aenigmarchaeota archaeon]
MQEYTRLPARTLRYGLHILKEKGLVLEKWNLGDMRKKSYSIHPLCNR